MKKLVFWQNIPSIHQAALVSAIARIWSGEVVVVTEYYMPKERLRQGWYMPDYGGARLIVAPSLEERDRIAEQAQSSDCVHVFSGFQAYPLTYRMLQRMLKTPSTVGVYAEAGQTSDGLKTILRMFRYGIHAVRWRRNLDFLLATGEFGVQWYRNVGFPASKIYAFGYFIDSEPKEILADKTEPRAISRRDEVKLIFVGEIVAWKGVDLMMRALAIVKTKSWCLDIVGNGPLMSTYKNYAARLGLSERIRWLEFEKNYLVRVRMARADILILPSRYDGWGVVVNEALMAGTRVIASDSCGAADLLKDDWRGAIFPSGSIKALSRSIAMEIDKGKMTGEWRMQIRGWAKRCISPDAAAQYFMNIVSHARHENVRPIRPWGQ